jgi:hypothetical protein
MPKKLVLLGVGNAAFAVKRAAVNYERVMGTTRNPSRVPQLEDAGIEPLLIEAGTSALPNRRELAEISSGADVLVSFPPNKASDELFSELAVDAKAIVYISSTSVYGRLQGKIDESSPVDLESPSAVVRLEAETVWRQRGAVILRAAGLYGYGTGLHKRLRAGTYKIPGDGSNYVSRIHLDDLAQIILAAFERGQAGAVFVVADSRPATHLEVATWLCERLQIPIPDTVPLNAVHETLRGNRQICSQRVLEDLGVQLRYPSFVDGYGSMLK